MDIGSLKLRHVILRDIHDHAKCERRVGEYLKGHQFLALRIKLWLTLIIQHRYLYASSDPVEPFLQSVSIAVNKRSDSLTSIHGCLVRCAFDSPAIAFVTFRCAHLQNQTTFVSEMCRELYDFVTDSS